jgi:hypothetical protein
MSAESVVSANAEVTKVEITLLFIVGILIEYLL